MTLTDAQHSALYRERHPGYQAGYNKRFRQAHPGCWKGRPNLEWSSYRNARQRCTNPKNSNWKNYGGRGIQFLFTSFAQFMAVLGKKPTPQHTLDRFPNNDGHYEPGNVRWATMEEQAATRRKPKLRRVTC